MSIPMGRYVRSNGSPATAGNMATGARDLAIPQNETDGVLTGTGSARFGSAHPDLVNFLLGDGSVRGIPLATPSQILAALGTVNDGTNVVMP